MGYSNYINQVASTYINSMGLAFLVVMGALLLTLPKRLALLPIICMVCYMSLGTRVIIAGMNFTMIRILLLIGWSRVVIRGECHRIAFTVIDRLIFWWILSTIIMNTLLWQTTDAFINRLGYSYDIIGWYILFRMMLTNIEDFASSLKLFAISIIPLAMLIAYEKITGRNMFAIFGGVPEFAYIRDGVVRCQGPFAHPILAGSFAAALMPLLVSLWFRGGAVRVWAFFGVASSALITAASGSSGPVMAFSWGVLGLLMWPLQQRMRQIRWGIGLAVIGLHLVMKSPVWFLIGRISVFSSSTGYHRAILIDMAVRHLSEWWLVGTRSTEAWLEGLFDVTNEYLWQGVNGGLLTMILFIAIISRCFGAIGRAMKRFEDRTFGVRLCMWAMGCALLTHVATFFSVSYFDQNRVMFMFLLAMISAVDSMDGATSHGVGVTESVTRRWQRANESFFPVYSVRLAHEEAMKAPYSVRWWKE